MFQQGGVSPNPQGYAYGAAQPYGGGLGVLAQMQLLKGFSGSDSHSSSSSKVSIVKYDDEFGKGWCASNLHIPAKPAVAGVVPSPRLMTDEEVKKNPPLALKFGDKECNVLIPIPSHEAMCKTSKELVAKFIGTGMHSDDTKKKASQAISKALIYNYVAECDYSDKALGPMCFAAQDLLSPMPAQSQAENKQAYINASKGDDAKYDAETVGTDGKIAANFKDTVHRYT